MSARSTDPNWWRSSPSSPAADPAHPETASRADRAEPPVQCGPQPSCRCKVSPLPLSGVLAAPDIQTLRYYERRGLIAEPLRSLGGHRAYPPRDD
ncbi:MerR family DNA-binding transcriptional regulator [Streptosporangium subroseum]|uniref:MerR family DNA-binding transcriptional regulator n=1 Tax=Streptosporangium subroseum TaxID=106412 RepID=UPI003423408A